jgi:hypothetical protein
MSCVEAYGVRQVADFTVVREIQCGMGMNQSSNASMNR